MDWIKKSNTVYVAISTNYWARIVLFEGKWRGKLFPKDKESIEIEPCNTHAEAKENIKTLL